MYNMNICCDDKTFSCTHNYWHKIRTNIVKATMDYIKDKFTKDKEAFTREDKNDVNYIGLGSYYNYHMNRKFDCDPNYNNNIINLKDEKTHDLNICNNL